VEEGLGGGIKATKVPGHTWMVQGGWHWGAVLPGTEVFCIAHHGGEGLLLQMSAEVLHGTQAEANLSPKAGTEMGQKAPEPLS